MSKKDKTPTKLLFLKCNILGEHIWNFRRKRTL